MKSAPHLTPKVLIYPVDCACTSPALHCSDNSGDSLPQTIGCCVKAVCVEIQHRSLYFWGQVACASAAATSSRQSGLASCITLLQKMSNTPSHVAPNLMSSKGSTCNDLQTDPAEQMFNMHTQSEQASSTAMCSSKLCVITYLQVLAIQVCLA